LIVTIGASSALAAAPSVAWDKTYGGTASEEAYSIVAASDGYVMAGMANYDSGTRYQDDLRVVKTDLSGNMVWNKTYGRMDRNEQGRSIVAVSDGYVIAVYAQNTTYSNNNIDMCLYKLDLNGNLVWTKEYSNYLNTNGDLQMIGLSDGFLLIGTSYVSSVRNTDVLLVKTDLNGDIIWSKTYGGNNEDYGRSVVAVSDGYVLAGNSISFTKSIGQSIYFDIYLIKTDKDGNLAWQNTYPSSDDQYAHSVAALSDGYVVVGRTFGDGWDMYLVKADLSGNFVWNKTSTRYYEGLSIVGVSDGAIITGVHTVNYDDYLYLEKVYSNGNIAWELDHGLDAIGYSVITSGDEYVVAGQQNWDFYLLKTGSDSESPTSTPTATPTATPQPPHLSQVRVTDPTSLTPTFSWIYDDPEGSPQAGYQAEVRTGSGGSGTLVWSTSGSGTAGSITYGGDPLTDGQTYYFRLRVFDGTAWSAWTETSWIAGSNATPTPGAGPSHQTFDEGGLSDNSYIYENGVLVKTIGTSSAISTPVPVTPTPTSIPLVTSTPVPATPTPTIVPTVVPATPTPEPATDNGSVGWAVAIIAVILVAVGAAYYLFLRKK
jgi:hypothetical protein